jgi:DNA end-binding protein Ku
MRSIWNGAIAFGLVNIPVSLFAAETNNDLKFIYRDAQDENRIRYKRINEITGEEVPWAQIVRSYEFPDGDYVIMTEDDFAKADPAAVKTVDIETFIRKDELSLMYLEKPYYLEPAKGAEKPYVLLRDALAEANKIAVARVVLRSREHLAVIYPKDDALVLNLIRFYDDVRTADDLQIPHEAKVSAKEMELALSLIDGMTAAWQPEEYKDE